MKFNEYLEQVKLKAEQDDMPGPMKEWLLKNGNEFIIESANKVIKWIKQNNLRIKGWNASKNPLKEYILNIHLNNNKNVYIFEINGIVKINNKIISSLKEFENNL